MADITLPVQPVFDVPRSFFDKVVPGTLINGQVHFSTEQCCDLMEVSQQNWSNRMAARAAAENSMGTVQVYPWSTTYLIPVFYPSQPGSNRTGITSVTQFHHPRKLLEEAMSIRDQVKRNTLVHWLIDVGNSVIQQGFAVDQYAAVNDPNVAYQLAELQRKLAESERNRLMVQEQLTKYQHYDQNL